MDGRRHRARITAAVLIAGACLVAAQPAGAYNRDDTRSQADARTSGQGVDVVFTRTGDGQATGHQRGGTSSCEWHATEFNSTTSVGDSLPPFFGESPGDGYVLYVIWCGDQYMRTRWLGPRDFTDSAVLPIVDELVRRVSVQPAGMNIRPDSRGVTGIPSLFWIEGYGNAPLTASESAFGLTVNVTVALTGVEWDFGDGTPVMSAGLGEAWPERSSVRHTYRMVSGDEPFEVVATLILQPSFDVNGAGGGILAPIRIPVGRDYVVHEVQAMRKK
jgi:hypothetical protein